MKPNPGQEIHSVQELLDLERDGLTIIKFSNFNGVPNVTYFGSLGLVLKNEKGKYCVFIDMEISPKGDHWGFQLSPEEFDRDAEQGAKFSIATPEEADGRTFSHQCEHLSELIADSVRDYLSREEVNTMLTSNSSEEPPPPTVPDESPIPECIDTSPTQECAVESSILECTNASPNPEYTVDSPAPKCIGRPRKLNPGFVGAFQSIKAHCLKLKLMNEIAALADSMRLLRSELQRKRRAI